MTIRDRLGDLYDSFSIRKRQSSPGKEPDVISDAFRKRVLLYWRDYISGNSPVIDQYMYDQFLFTFWPEMHNALQNLYGRFYLSDSSFQDDIPRDLEEFLWACSAEEFFDFMELAFKLPVSWRLRYNSDHIVDSFNAMFRIEDLPYQLTYWIVCKEADQGLPTTGPPPMRTTIDTTAFPQVIRVDEDVTHQEAIKPALAALNAPHFNQPNQDFLKALRHYRDDEFADCLTACGATMESTLKVLCDRNGWQYNQTDTLKTLLDVVILNSSLESFFKQTLMLIGTIRNHLSSAHGRGAAAQPVPRHIAQYAITNTAAAVILLIEDTDH